MREGGALLDVGRGPRRRFPASGHSLARRSPNRAIRVHSALDWTPYRVPHHLPAVRPVGRTDSPEVSAPYDDSTRTSPVLERGFVHPHPGAARRFSQPLGGFWHVRACGLVSCRCRPWAASPFRALPRRDRASPLGAAGSLAVIPTQPARTRAALSPRVSPTPTSSLRPLPVSPRGYGFPFSAPPMADTPPGHPGPRAVGSRPTTRIIRFEALIPLRNSRCRPRGCYPQEQPCSPGRSAPPELSPPAPRTL